MYCPKRRKLLCTSKLVQLVKTSKNEELKCILQNAKPSDLVFDNGWTLLHLAASHNNQELIKYLLDTGFDVDAKNSFGDTALLTALKSDNYGATKMLLDADADVCVIDESTGDIALRILTIRIELGFKDFILNLLHNLERKKLSGETIAELLTKANFPFVYYMLSRNYEVSQKFLERNPSADYYRAMKFAMRRGDLQHIELILRYSNNEDSEGKSVFYDKLQQLFKCNQMESWKLIIELLVKWDVVCDQAIRCLEFMFYSATPQGLLILLHSKIDVIVREKLGIDLRTAIFANGLVKPMEILRNQNFNVNAVGVKKQTALYYAVTAYLTANTRFLLDRGADVNSQNDSGLSILFWSVASRKIDSGLLLLEYGADAQAIYCNTLPKPTALLEFARINEYPILDSLIARLAIDHVKGVPIKQIIQNQIDSQSALRQIFDTCCQQLQDLKTREIIESVTFYTILTEKIENYCRHLCNYDSLAALDRLKNEYELHSLYYSMLKRKLISIRTQYCFKCELANVIAKATGRVVDFDNLVIRKISKCLTQWDMNEFIKSNE